MGFSAVAPANSSAVLLPPRTDVKAPKSDLVKIARQRLYPSLSNPNFLVLRSRRLIFEKWIANLRREPLKILDIGGRYQPYRPLFDELEHEYFACDLLSTDLTNVVATGEALPFAQEKFDLVICTQVFEYFSNPHIAAQEIFRVLKPGGSLLMSVAACAPRFVQEECWRYTPRGVRAVLSKFSAVTIMPETSSMGGLFRTANLAIHTLAHFSTLRKLLELSLCPSLNLAGLALEKLRLTSNDQFAANYSVLASK
jgi:SAM-dependent methyltransferase